MKRAPEIIATGKVVRMVPALLNERDAATYVGVSPALLKRMRSTATKALGQGGTASASPAWIVLGGSMIRYRVAALDEWIERTSKPLGAVESHKRTKAAP